MCSGDGGKADARKSVSDAIGKATQRAKSNVKSMLAPVIRDMDSQKRQLSNSVKKNWLILRNCKILWRLLMLKCLNL